MIEQVLRIRPDATPASGEGGRIVFSRGFAELTIGPLAPLLTSALETLLYPGATEAELLARVTEEVAEMTGAAGGRTVRADQLAGLLTALQEGGWLERTLRVDGAAMATLRPTTNRPLAGVPDPDPSAAVVLSRFALLHREGDEAVLESPRSGNLVVLHDPRLGAVVAELAHPTKAADLFGAGLPREVLRAVVALLGQAGLLIGAEAGTDEERDNQALAQWSLPDLLFHARSRQGRHAHGYGPTYRLRDRFPLPRMARPLEGEPFDLARPEQPVGAGPSFDEVIDSRQSVRDHDDDAPMTAAQLGEFLYRAARVRPEVTVWADGTARGAGTARPYPTGGALYELELYPVVGRCAGLGPGLYRYDPFGHRLGRVADTGPAVERFLEDGRRKSEMASRPQVAIVVTARFGRTMWKYESIAYALILKDVGVLYQTMYLVATAMGLSACGIGGGDSDAFSEAAGLDYFTESSVGELLLGSRPGRSF